MNVDFMQIWIDQSKEWHNKYHYLDFEKCDIPDCVLARRHEEQRKRLAEKTERQESDEGQ